MSKNYLNCKKIDTSLRGVKMEKKILKAAKKYFNNYPVEDNKITVLYEHGQYWIRLFDEHEEVIRMFSVVDAEGIGSINGFDFEEV